MHVYTHASTERGQFPCVLKHLLLQEGGEEGLSSPQSELVAVDHLNIRINLQWTWLECILCLCNAGT